MRPPLSTSTKAPTNRTLLIAMLASLSFVPSNAFAENTTDSADSSLATSNTSQSSPETTESYPLKCSANEAFQWTEGKVQWLWLRGNAQAQTTTQNISGHHLLIQVTPTADGNSCTIISPPQKRIPTRRWILNTSSSPTLECDIMTRLDGPPSDPLIAICKDAINAKTPEPVEPTKTTDQQNADEQRRLRQAQVAQANKQANNKATPKISQSASDNNKLLDELRLFPKDALIHVNADRAAFTQDPLTGKNIAILSGNVQLIIHAPSQPNGISLRAGNVVLLLNSSHQGKSPPSELSAVDGIYLEDSVQVSHNDLHLRAPRIYYDTVNQRALLLDAVAYMWHPAKHIPFYVRAQLLRQTSSDRYTGRNVTLANTAFAKPPLAVNTKSFTLSRQDNNAPPIVEINHVTMDIEGMPVLWLPGARTRADVSSIKKLTLGYDSQDGATVETEFDLNAIFKTPLLDDTQVSGHLDWYGQHGLALGLSSNYTRENSFGSFAGYYLPADNGTDYMPGRLDLERDGEDRGFVRLEHKQWLTNNFSLSVEGAWSSDPALLESLWRKNAYTQRPLSTGLALDWQNGNDSAEMVYSSYTGDSINEYITLSGRGFSTDRIEGGFYRTNLEILDGLAVLYSENRVGAVRAHYDTTAPIERGFSNAQSLSIFRQNNLRTFEQQAVLSGETLDWVRRFDTRQEIRLPLALGALDITPYGIGRFTAWDDKLPSSEHATERFFGGIGIQLSSELTSDPVAIDIDWLNVHGLRHIVRPVLDLSHFDSNVSLQDLPLYDLSIEGIEEADNLMFALEHTWQTQRGNKNSGWRSVDWLKWNSAAILRNFEDTPNYAVPRHDFSRPELNRGGDHLFNEMAWLITEIMTLSGEATWSLDRDEMDQWSIRAEQTHSKRLRTHQGYLETRFLNESLFYHGFDCQLTEIYAVALSHYIDTDRGESRGLEATVERRFPGWRLQANGHYDEIDNRWSVGISFIPEGIGGNKPIFGW